MDLLRLQVKGVESGFDMIISSELGIGFEPLAITLFPKFCTVHSIKNLGFTPTPLTILDRASSCPIPASRMGSSKFLGSSQSIGVYLKQSFKSFLFGQSVIYRCLISSSSSSSSSSNSSSIKGSLISSKF